MNHSLGQRRHDTATLKFMRALAMNAVKKKIHSMVVTVGELHLDALQTPIVGWT